MSLLLLRVGTFPIEEHDFSLLGKNKLINKPTFKTFFYKILKSINHLILKLNVAHKKIYFQHFFTLLSNPSETNTKNSCKSSKII